MLPGPMPTDAAALCYANCRQSPSRSPRPSYDRAPPRPDPAPAGHEKHQPPRIVSEMLGHSTVAITLDTYSHVTAAMHRGAADTLDALLGPRATEGRA